MFTGLIRTTPILRPPEIHVAEDIDLMKPTEEQSRPTPPWFCPENRWKKFEQLKLK